MSDYVRSTHIPISTDEYNFVDNTNTLRTKYNVVVS